MGQGVFIAIWFVIFVFVVVLTYQIRNLKEDGRFADNPKRLDTINTVQNVIYAVLVLVIVLGIILLYLILKGSIYEGHLKDWLNLVIRLMHITFGIAWIGASFYFVFLENALNRTEEVRDELAGNLWAIHGGGFYYLEKYKVAPTKIPKELHWFKYEAYFTWLTGFCLLIVVYYFNAKSYLIDPKVLDISEGNAIILGLSSLLLGWIIYDVLCKKLVKQQVLFLILSFVFMIGFAYFFANVFSGRAAYMHFGALLGTIMAANVFFVIIPGQKAMVEAAKNGLPPNPLHAEAAGMRSRHNNYLTFPVLFVMISNHFPSTFGNEQQWIVLIAITLGLVGVKHYLNLREQKKLSFFIMPASVILLFAVAFYTAPSSNLKQCKKEVSFSEVSTIIANRCVSCHSASPKDEVWKNAPNGVKFDSPDQIFNMKDKIFQRVVVIENMPFNNNQTGMTPEERSKIECWINQGGKK